MKRPTNSDSAKSTSARSHITPQSTAVPPRVESINLRYLTNFSIFFSIFFSGQEGPADMYEKTERGGTHLPSSS
jgi:hypothetical protein